MCGITCYIGKNNAVSVVLNCLKKLEYRGYDSSGIALVNNNAIDVFKKAGKIENLEKFLDKDLYSENAIGHTRWATHGKAVDENAHPHKVGKITIVHNGIIENYEELKANLIDSGYSFKGETDTEVAASYIDYIYKEEKNMIQTLNKALKVFVGSYALGIICEDEVDKIYGVRKESPLVVGIKNGDGNFIASDVPAMLEYTNEYFLLEENEIAVLEKNKVQFYKNNEVIKKDLLKYEEKAESITKKGYPHYMLKEMNEQKNLGKETINYLKNVDFDLSDYENIDIISCGSAYNAGVCAKYLFDKYTNKCVNVFIASEYRYNKFFKKNKHLTIFISQSGETADTLAALKLAKKNNVDTLSIVNVKNSSVARESDKVIYTIAGPEIAVATTKGYFSQLITLEHLILNDSLKSKIISESEFNKFIMSFDLLDSEIEKLLAYDYDEFVEKIYNKNNLFYLGRKIDFGIALEASLKLKEISYIHSEAFASGELKHGTIALIEENMPVISIISDEDIMKKSISNNKEVLSRGAYVLLISPFVVDDGFTEMIKLKNINDFINPCMIIVVTQMLAYKVAVKKGLDVDKPKNLAKSVTVE